MARLIVPLLDRIMAKSVPADRGYVDECHVYTGSLMSEGYGYAYAGPGQRPAQVLVHRAVWEAAHGPIPIGVEIDHLCRQRDCHRLTHLELVTRSENIRRAPKDLAAMAERARGRERTPRGTFV